MHLVSQSSHHQISVLQSSKFTFANNLWNINSGSNTLVFNNGLVTVNPGFYTFQQLISTINTTLLSAPAFVASMGPATDAVTLDSLGRAIRTIGTNVLLSGGLYDTLLLQKGATFTGDFQTGIFIAAPMCISLSSGALSTTTQFVTSAIDNSKSILHSSYNISIWFYGKQ